MGFGWAPSVLLPLDANPCGFGVPRRLPCAWLGRRGGLWLGGPLQGWTCSPRDPSGASVAWGVAIHAGQGPLLLQLRVSGARIGQLWQPATLSDLCR